MPHFPPPERSTEHRLCCCLSCRPDLWRREDTPTKGRKPPMPPPPPPPPSTRAEQEDGMRRPIEVRRCSGPSLFGWVFIAAVYGVFVVMVASGASATP